MGLPSKFARTRPVNVPTQSLKPYQFFDLKGLDMYNPDELADDKRTPYCKNVRLFAPSDTSKRVAISKRFGHIFYSVPVGETLDTQQTSVTGAASQTTDTTNYLAMPFTPGTTGALTKVDLNIKNNASGTGPLLVTIYSNNAGSPGTLLATSSILSSSMTSSFQYLSARFIEAPSVTSGTQYWIAINIQAEGTNNYAWSSTTTVTTAKTSPNGSVWSTTAYGLNFKTYVSTTGGVLGIKRFYRSNGNPVTVFAFGTNVYTVNDITGAITSIKSGLSASSYFDFETVSNKLYWVNGVDAPQSYDGTTVATPVDGSPPVTADNVELHANRMFYLQTGTNQITFSDAASYETFQSTSFIYVPAPNTADAAIRIVSFQGNLVTFTKNTKYVLYGTDLTSFSLKESPAKKGAVSAAAITKDASFIYFLAPDGLVYRYNGGTDSPINSQRVWPILKSVASLSSTKLYVNNDQKLIVSYRSAGRSTNDKRLVYDLVYNEWLNDEETYSEMGIVLSSQSDTNQQVIGSSLVGALYYGNIGTNDLGKPINAEYRTKYFSFGNPAAKHRIKRLYVFLRGQTTNYQVDVQVDADEANSPVHNYLSLGAGGSLWGTAVWAAFTWGLLTFLRFRVSVPGANYKHQLRFVQGGVDNNMDLLGYEMYVLPRQAV